ncbi:translation elongation factor 2 [Phaffia rhodozyma]|uniref:Ribosome assembly protein 1 n=1 Tax=Phaffia rhodozyma TaxID=264483 RepID=A0A0F7SIE8_PHARH|nr:translation elongation factor 2 [Phaffia rhodozyma]
MSKKAFQSQSNVRSICVIAHVDHGKTSYCDSLLSANNIISSRLAGSLRYLDSREDEVERGITMESSAVSLGFKMLRRKNNESKEVVPQDFMINLIDTPGHVDFSSEVSTASRLCDGALVLVDAVEGVCTQTITVLRQAWLDKLRPILVINKLDRLITELRLSPSEGYHHLSQLIEGVNAIMGSFYASDRMEDDLRWREERERRMAARREAEAGRVEESGSATPEDGEDEEGNEFEEKDDEDIYFAPERGNVIFASAIDGWAFRVGKFAQLYAQKLKIEESKLRKVLWGDYYLDPKTKRVVSHKKLAGRSLKPMFVQFVLENIWRVYESVVLDHNSDKIDKIVASLNVKLHPRDLRTKEHKTLLSLIMSQWLPLSTTTFQTVVEIIPPPQIAQSIRVPKMLHPDAYTTAAAVLPTNKLEKDLYSCDPSPEAGIVAYVSKMFAVSKDQLPENKVVEITADEMRERSRLERQRRAAERERELALDRETLIGLGADGVSKSSVATLTPEGIPLRTTELNRNAEQNPAPTPAPAPPVKEENIDPASTSTEALIGFARLYSGTLKAGTSLHCLLPKYNTELAPSHPSNVKFINKVTVSKLYMMMGRDLVAVDEVPAGNVFAVGGLEGKVLRNATLCSLDQTGAVEGEDEEKLKAGLINLAGVIMTSPPIVRVALEPKSPADLPKLVEGLRLLNQADPCVETLVQETGEHVILTAGELHLERCLKDLRERFAKIEIQASKPIVPFRETAVKGVDMAPPKTKDAPRGTIEGSISNSLVNYTIRAVPLPLKITSFLQANTSVMRRIQPDRRAGRTSGEDDSDQVTSKQLTTEGGGDEEGAREVKPEEFWSKLREVSDQCGRDWVGVVDRIWAFGPKRVGPNLLIDRPDGRVKPLRQRYEASLENPSTPITDSVVDGPIVDLAEELGSSSLSEEARMMRDFDDSIETGFQLATFQGPLCAEPVVGMAYLVEKLDVEVSEDDENIRSKLAQATGSLISSIKDACRAGLLDWSPRVLLAMYTCDIQTSTEVLGKVYGVVARRRGKIVAEEMKEGTSFFTVRALLPVIESFGFADEIRKRSSGAASPQLVFSGYQMIDQDPYWVPTTEEELEDLGTLAERANIAKVYVDGVRTRKGITGILSRAWTPSSPLLPTSLPDSSSSEPSLGSSISSASSSMYTPSLSESSRSSSSSSFSLSRPRTPSNEVDFYPSGPARTINLYPNNFRSSARTFPSGSRTTEPSIYDDRLETYEQDDIGADGDEDEDEDGRIGENHPRRFERRFADDGRPFYVDHHLKITTWELYKPRKQTLRRKVKYVREQILSKVRGREDLRASVGMRERACIVIVRREDLFETAFDALAQKSSEDLKRKFYVHFDQEEGIDAGGLTREFFQLLSMHIADPSYGLFHAPSTVHPNLLSINPNSAINPAHLDYFRVVGRLIGLALLNGEKVSVGFAGVVWKLLVGGIEVGINQAEERSTTTRRRRRNETEDVNDGRDDCRQRRKRRRGGIGREDLKGVDDELEKSLEWVQNNDPSVLYRSFTHPLDAFGAQIEVPLRPNGAEIDVTEDNKEEYVSEVSRFVLVESVREQTEAMLRGLDEVVERRFLSTLEPAELELLICGISEIDVDDWQAHTDYRSGYYFEHPSIQLFWAFVRTLSSDQKMALLQFVTSSTRLPPGGFAYLKATGSDLKRFTIVLDSRPGSNRLPSAHTCFNELELPPYMTWEDMERALGFAISETEGFAQQ